MLNPFNALDLMWMHDKITTLLDL